MTIAELDDDGPKPSLMTIKRAVCAHFGVSMPELLSIRRGATLVQARHTAMYLAKKLTSRTLHEIGYYIGGRHHTTVIYAVRKVQSEIDDPLSDAHHRVRACAEACRPDVLPGKFPWRTANA